MDIIKTITDSVTQFFTGMGSSVVDMFEKLFINAEGQMTTFAIVSLTFLGLSFAMGLFYTIFKMIKR